LKHLLSKGNLSREEIIFLLNIDDPMELEHLFKRANEVRKFFCGNDVHLRGIIEFSNHCDQRCLYCGLRCPNNELERYRMSKNEIVETALFIYSSGIKTIVLQSGEDSFYNTDDIEEIIISIKKDLDVAITLSIGEREFFEYDRWKRAGADRYLLKHETANPRLYASYHQNQNLQDRLNHLEYLTSIGFQTGGGNIVGLPGQSVEDIADDILLLKEFNVDMASISPFIPSANTPYGNKPPCDIDLLLKTMAIARLVLKNSHIPSTTALSTLVHNGRERGLQAGANVIMPNFTPQPYKERYVIYENKARADSDPIENVRAITNLINSVGRTVGSSKGHSLKSISNLI
jgi:biotin synthase